MVSHVNLRDRASPFKEENPVFDSWVGKVFKASEVFISKRFDLLKTQNAASAGVVELADTRDLKSRAN